MKKIFLYIVGAFLLPLGVNAEIEVFLSSGNLPYSKDLWTSDSYPSTGTDSLQIVYKSSREDIPGVYLPTQLQKQQRITSLFSYLNMSDRMERYQSLDNFSTENFIDYLALALSPDIESDISERQSFGETLTPFESVFQACGLSLTIRQDIVRDLIERIYDGDYTEIDDIEYSNISFGDCIIPFPAASRTSSQILGLSNTFPSNIYLASVAEDTDNFLRFPDEREQDVSVLSLGIAGYQRVKDLNLETVRIESSSVLPKSHGKNRIKYVHKNHYVNPFRNAYINGSTVSGRNYQDTQNISGVFESSHPLYIEASDDEEARIIYPWTQIQPGIYQKILLQEDTFDASGNPRQHVGATSYYAILYNHDVTPPTCAATLFSHDSTGNETFQFEEDTWFREEKYAFFVCSDIESGCSCDSTMPGCFTRNGNVMSIPQILPHNGNISYIFQNNAGNTVSCNTPDDKNIRYDFISPDMRLRQDGLTLTELTREYVSNQGLLYNGIQTPNKRYYNIVEIMEFEASDTLDIDFELYDILPNAPGQARSRLASYRIDVSQQVGTVWRSLGSLEKNDFSSETSHTLSLETLSESIVGRNIRTQTGRYQFTIHIEDKAGNTSRVIWQYRIIPGSISIENSVLEVSDRNSFLANNIEDYEYTLTLRDNYNNPIPQRQVQNIVQTCIGISTGCKVLRTDMSGASPGGSEALRFTLLAGGLTDEAGKAYFRIRSLAPGVFTERFRVNFQNPSESFIFSFLENSFLKPVTGILETLDAGVWYNDRLYVGDEREYRLVTNISGGIVNPTFSISGTIEGRHPSTGFTLSGSVISSPSGLDFRGTFNSSLPESENHKVLLEIVESPLSNRSGVIVSYALGAQTIYYRLSPSNRLNTQPTLSDTRELNNPVKMIGGLQGAGNTHNGNERQNISDINSVLQRTIFRKNITQHIRGRTHNTTVGGIKYIDLSDASNKNYTLEANPNYDTLIVHNGNILINQDFNLEGKRVGLISYIDNGYNVETGYTGVGNIYISPNISRINGFIYTDGAIISTDGAGTPIINNRSSILQSQLTIKGLLFTRNTLAGSRILDGSYMLPGGRESNSELLAVQYDLYQTRKGNNGCIQDSYGFCNIPHYLIIEYDNRIVSSPPPLFSQ